MIDDSEAQAQASSMKVQAWDQEQAVAPASEAYHSVIGHVARFTAHALGNPLAGLSLTLDLLANASSENDVRRLVGRCQRIAERLNAFKENLGALGGSLNCPMQTIDIKAFLAERQDALNPAHAYSMPLQVDPDAGKLYCNSGLLTNALSYLVGNACDASPDGGTIGIRVTRADNATLLTVWDDGPGMPAELVNEVFRAPISTKKHGGGLGLLIVSMIVEHVHGGKVRFAPYSPHGCQFHLEFPDGPEHLS